MAKAKKLPSGSWRCLVYSHTEKVMDEKTGKMKDKRIYESFTSNIPGSAGKQDAELQAARFAAEKERATPIPDMTFGEALDAYIKSRESILSAATIREYKRTRKSDFRELENIKIGKITQEQIQIFINQKTQEKKSPKTVRNIHGIISAVLGAYRPNMALKTALPQKIPASYIFPRMRTFASFSTMLKMTI